MKIGLFFGLVVVVVAAISIFLIQRPDKTPPSATEQRLTLEERFPELVRELGEPLTQVFVDRFEDTNLEFVLDTARVTTNEFGATEIVWDEPEGTRPSVSEALKMTAEANATGDSSLLPFCSQAYWGYLKENKPPKGQKTCVSLPNSVVLGLPSLPGR